MGLNSWGILPGNETELTCCSISQLLLLYFAAQKLSLSCFLSSDTASIILRDNSPSEIVSVISASACSECIEPDCSRHARFIYAGDMACCVTTWRSDGKTYIVSSFHSSQKSKLSGTRWGMRGESCHMLCVEHPVPFILCNDNLAKFVVRKAHQIGKHCGVQLPCSGDCSPCQESPTALLWAPQCCAGRCGV